MRADAQLIDCLQQVTESLLSEWLSHSTLRLSVLDGRAPKPGRIGAVHRLRTRFVYPQFLHLASAAIIVADSG
jgi:hypothetical protein